MNVMYWIRRALAAAGLITALFLAGAVVLRADDDCPKRINKADHNLHEAIEHHGRDSEQAAGTMAIAGGTPMPITGAPTMTLMTTTRTTTKFVI